MTVILNANVWPGSDGSVGQVPVSDGAGNLAFSSVVPFALVSATAGSLKGRGLGISESTPSDFPILNQNTTGTANNVTGVISILNGGTGQITASAAITALLPTQVGNSGAVLCTDGDSVFWQPLVTAAIYRGFTAAIKDLNEKVESLQIEIDTLKSAR